MARYKTLNAVRLAHSLELELSDRDQDQISRYVDGVGVVITGLLKRGKSTLVNSLIGRPVLPTGRAPESWCPVSLRTGLRHTVTATFASSGQLELPITERDLPRALGRDGELRAQDARTLAVTGEFRLPDGLVLLDTRGADEAEVSDSRPAWRSVGARSAVLVSSFPPGVGSADRELYESLREFFGNNVLVVLKSTDSAVGIAELQSAAKVWTDLDVQPILVSDSRELRSGEWGSGEFAELESQISALEKNALDSLEDLATEVEKILVDSLQQLRARVLATPGTNVSEIIGILGESFGIELPNSISNIASSLYVELYETHTNFAAENINSLFRAAHRGSPRARKAIADMWSNRLARGASKVAKNALTSTPITTLLELLKTRPAYSTYDARTEVECTIEDLEKLNQEGQLNENSLVILSSGIVRCVERTSQLTEINRLMSVHLAEREQRTLVKGVVDRILEAHKNDELQHLTDIATRLTPPAWQLSTPQVLVQLKIGVHSLLKRVEDRCRLVTTDIPDSSRMFFEAHRRQKATELQTALSVDSAALEVVALIAEVFFDDLAEVHHRLKDLIHGDRKLVEWVDYHYPEVSHVELVRTNAARRDVIFVLSTLVVFAVGVGLGDWFTIPGLVGAVALVALGFSRRVKYPIEILNFDQFSSGSRLNLLQRRQLWQNIAVVSGVVLVSSLGFYANDEIAAGLSDGFGVFSSAERDASRPTATTTWRRPVPSAELVSDQFSKQQIQLGDAQLDNIVSWRLETRRLGSRLVPRNVRAVLCPKKIQDEVGKSRRCVISAAVGIGPDDAVVYTFQFRLDKDSAGGSWFARALLRPSEVLIGSAEVEVVGYNDPAAGEAEPNSNLSTTTTSTTTTTVRPVSTTVSSAIPVNFAPGVWLSADVSSRDFVFSLSSTQVFTARTLASGGDPALWLYSASGVLLAFNDYQVGLGKNAEISVQLGAGTYRLRAGVCCDDPNVWIGASYQIRTGLGLTTTPFFSPGALLSVSASNRDFVFWLSSTQVFTARTQAASGDPALWLYSWGGTLIESNDDGVGLGTNSEISVQLGAGLYRLRAGVCCDDPTAWTGTSYQIATGTG